MTATERLYQLIQTFPKSQITEVFHFAEFLQHKQLATPQLAIPPGALTSLRGLAKQSGANPHDDDLQAVSTDYLAPKYQSACL